MSDTNKAKAEGVEAYARAYFGRLAEALAALEGAQLKSVAAEFLDARDRDATVFLMGNGGSAATAAHMLNDLSKVVQPSRGRPFRTMSLVDNMPLFSALANDEGYASVFARQLEILARPGDLVVGISASGESKNMVEGFEYARSAGVRTVAIVGFEGGAMARIADAVLHVPSDRGDYGVVEDAHAAIGHMLATYLAEALEG